MWYTVTLFRDEAEAARVVSEVVVPLLTRRRIGRSRLRGAYLQRGYDGMAYARVHARVDGNGGSLDDIYAFGTELRSAAVRLPRVETGRPDVRRYTDGVLANYEIRTLRKQLERRHNDVLVAVDDTAADVYGGPAGLALLRKYLACNTNLLCAIGPHPELAGRLRWLAFEQLVQVVRALRIAEGLDNSYLSLRSHVEGFIASRSSGEREMLRSGFEATFEKARATLLESAERYWKNDAPPDPILASWFGLVEGIRASALNSCVRGVLRLPQDEEFAQRRQARGRESVHRADAVRSEYHRYWEKSPDAMRYQASAEFQARRFLLNLVYEGLQQLGITALERYSLCYCVAKAVEESIGDRQENVR